jgi:hypothetical protein
VTTHGSAADAIGRLQCAGFVQGLVGSGVGTTLGGGQGHARCVTPWPTPAGAVGAWSSVGEGVGKKTTLCADVWVWLGSGSERGERRGESVTAKEAHGGATVAWAGRVRAESSCTLRACTCQVLSALGFCWMSTRRLGRIEGSRCMREVHAVAALGDKADQRGEEDEHRSFPNAWVPAASVTEPSKL